MKSSFALVLVLFVNSFSYSQTYEWAKGFGNTASDEGFDVVVDGSGNVYVTGSFSGTTDFDPGAGTANLTSAGLADIYIAKYDANGNYLWAKRIGDLSDDYGSEIVLDASGNIYITGGFQNTADFDPGVGTANLTGVGLRDIFFAKYDANGNYIWAKSIGGGNIDSGNSIAVASSGNVYITGYFALTADFDPGTGTANLVSAGNQDIFFAKYDANGNYLWAKRIGGSLADWGESVVVDATSVYISGVFESATADFDPGAGTANLSSSSGNFDIFFAKYNGSGIYQWAKDVGDVNDDMCNSIAVDASGNVYITGSFWGTMDFDPGAGTANLTGTSDIYIAKYNSSGSYVWANSIGGVGGSGNSLVLDASANIYVTGTFSNTTDFDPGAGTANFTSAGGWDFFFAKYNTNGNYIWANGTGGTSTDRGSGIAVDASGFVYITGSLQNTADFDPGAGTANLTSAGNFDIYLAKYSNCLSSPPAPGTISGTSAICEGSTNTYSVAAVSGATSYTWTLPSGWSGTSTTNSISTTASATSGNITVTANNSCGSSSAATLAITVTPIPATPGAIAGTTTVCSGTSNTYSVVAVSGATSYTWTLPSGWTGTSTTNSITTTASSTGGNITVTANNACGSSTASSVTINVDAAPATPTSISGFSTICSGSSNNYAVTNDPTATSYNWTLPSGWSGSSTTNTISTTSSATSGNISVTATNSCGTSAASTLAVTVNAIPVTPGSISGTTSICSGSSHNYSITAVPGATSYTWTLPSGWSGTSTTNTITTTSSSTSGNITVTADNSCGSSAAASLAIAVTTSAPSTPGTISGTTTICSGSNNTYSVAAVAGATSYTWTLPSGWSGTSTTNSIAATASASSGNIMVTANNVCGSSSASTQTITVNAAPAAPGAISGTSTICSGSNNTYSIAAVSGATSYTWTLPSGWSGSSTTNSISTTASVTSGNITVTAANACGNSAASTLAITVNTVPSTPGSISGNASICSGSTNTYSIAAVPGATSYTWTLPSGWTGTSATNSITTTASSTSGDVSVIANNACGSSPANTLAVSVVAAVPSPPGSISGSILVCSGTTSSYSVAAVAGADSYTWTMPSGWSGSSTTNSINATASSTSGDISVVANNVCGSSAPAVLTISVDSPLAAPGPISGPAAVCTGTTNTYSIAAVSGASAYVWTLPSGWSGTSTTTSILASAGTLTGTVSVAATNACGTSSATTLNILTVMTNPVNPAPVTGSVSVCAGSSNVYSITPVGDASTYTWTLPLGWSGSSTSSTISATAGATGGTVSVIANNFCGSSSAANLPVTILDPPSAPGSISGPTSICESSTNTYSIAAVSGATSYVWDLPPGWSGSSSGTSISATAAAGGDISVIAQNACGSSSPQSLTITVNPLPVVSLVLSPDFLCEYSASEILSGGTPAGGTYTGSGVSANSLDPSGLSAGTYVITYTYTDANFCTATSTDNIVIDACLGVEEWNGDMNVYPNPTTGLLYLETDPNSAMNVFGLNGQFIPLEMTKIAGVTELDLSQFSDGIYLLEVTDPNGNVNRIRIVKQ